MTPLPQRKKTAEELAKLRESLGIPDPLPPAATTSPATPALPVAPMPMPAALPPPSQLPPPMGATPNPPAPSTSAPSAPDAPDVSAADPAPAAEEPVSLSVKRVRSLRKADHQAPPATRPAAPPADSPLPRRRHSVDELDAIRRREASTWQPVPDPRLAAAHPVLLVLGYLTALAGAVPLFYQPVPIEVPIGCVAISLLVAGLIVRSRPLSIHHAGFMAVICLFVIVFGALHYFPQLRHAT